MSTNTFKMRDSVIVTLPDVIEVGQIIIKSTAQTPSVPATGTGIVYSNNGIILYRGPNGTITLLANS